MKKIISALLAVVFLFGAQATMAAPQKIGVVDLQKIMQNAPQMREIQSNLEKTYKPRRDKLVAMEEALKKDMETFKKDTAVMSAAKRKEFEEKIIAQQQQLEQQGQQYQQELTAANNQAMEGFYNKIKAAIAKIAETEKYDIVFQKDAAPFSVDALDVTNKVMKEIM